MRPLFTCSAILCSRLPPMLARQAIGRKTGWQQDRSCGGVRGLQMLKLWCQTHVRRRCQLPSRQRYEPPCALQVSSRKLGFGEHLAAIGSVSLHGHGSLFHGHGHTSRPLFHGWDVHAQMAHVAFDVPERGGVPPHRSVHEGSHGRSVNFEPIALAIRLLHRLMRRMPTIAVVLGLLALGF